MKSLILLLTFIFLCGINLLAAPNPMSNVEWEQDPSDTDGYTKIDIYLELSNFGQVAAFVKADKRSKGLGAIEPPNPEVTLETYVKPSNIVHFYIFDNAEGEMKVYPAEQALIYNSDGTHTFINYFDNAEPVMGNGTYGNPLTLTKSLDKPIIIIESNGAVCPGDIGSASLYIFGSGHKYTYQVAGQTPVDKYDDGVISTVLPHMLDLSSGSTHAVTVNIDGNTESEVKQEVTIANKLAPSLDVDKPYIISYACDNGMGTLTIDATNTFEYMFANGSPFSTTSDANVFEFDGLNTNGDFMLTLISSNGCSIKEMINIKQYRLLNPNINTSATIDCVDDLLSIPLNPSGGTPPYQYSIDGANSFSSIPSAIDIGGTTNIIIRDSSECEAAETITVTNNALSLILREGDMSGTVIDNNFGVPCNGDSVTISMIASGGATLNDYSFTVKDINSQPPMDLSKGNGKEIAVDLKEGLYEINLMNGSCSVIDTLTITQPAGLGIITENVVNACGGNPTGQIEIDVTGGTGTGTG